MPGQSSRSAWVIPVPPALAQPGLWMAVAMFFAWLFYWKLSRPFAAGMLVMALAFWMYTIAVTLLRVRCIVLCGAGRAFIAGGDLARFADDFDRAPEVLDGLLGEVPVLGMFTGYFLHPAYRITRAGSEAPVMRIVKRPALFEGVFRLEAPAIAGEEEAELLVLSTLMILLLERSRG